MSLKMNFRRIRVNKHKETEEEKLYKKLRVLKEKDGKDSIEETEKVLEAIAKVAELKYVKVMEELDKLKPEDGKIDSQRFWKIKKKLFPKSRDPPSAMFEKGNNLLTSDKSIVHSRALEVY